MRLATMFLLAMTVAAQAQTASAPIVVRPASTGNLPAGFYPKSPCVKGNSDFGPKPDQREIRKVEAYNEKIRAYNKSMENYNACIVDYAAKAQHDMLEIRAAINAANQ
jgi:hypothetical protein